MSDVISWLESPEGQNWSERHHVREETSDGVFASVEGQNRMVSPADREEWRPSELSWKIQGDRDLSADPTGASREKEAG